MPATAEDTRRLQAAAIAYVEQPSEQRFEAVLRRLPGFIHERAGHFSQKYNKSGLTLDDFKAEIKLGIWEALQEYKPGKAGFRTWLYRVVECRVQDYVKSLDTAKKQEEEYSEELEAHYRTPYLRNDIRAVETRLLIEQLACEVRGKDKYTNQLIFLLYMQGYSKPNGTPDLQAIGAKVSMKPDTVGDRWGRLRAGLRTYADSDGLDRAAILC